MTTANLALNQLVTGQTNAEISVNTFLNELDVLVQMSIKDRDLTAPPGSPSDGDRYIPAATATGAWVGKEGQIAAFYAGWIFFVPKEGWRLHVDDEDIDLKHDGTNFIHEERAEVEDNLTASTTQTQAAGTLITKRITRFDTVANANDAGTLPPALQGKSLTVINSGVNTLQVFAGSGDDIDDGSTNGSITIAAGAKKFFEAIDADSWYT